MYDTKRFQELAKEAYPSINDDKVYYYYAKILYAGYKIAKNEEKVDRKYDIVKKIISFALVLIMEIMTGFAFFFLGIELGAPKWGAFIMSFCSIYWLFSDNPLYKIYGKSNNKEKWIPVNKIRKTGSDLYFVKFGKDGKGRALAYHLQDGWYEPYSAQKINNVISYQSLPEE